MNTEEEIFKKEKVNFKKLIKYGFVKENNMYKFSKIFMNNQFRADIFIDKNGSIKGKVIDLATDEEYINYRIEEQVGKFVNTVRQEYSTILKDIANNCFEKELFIFEQTNRISKLIYQKYGDKPEFMWNTAPGYGVFRNPSSKKWYALIMNIDKSKIDTKETGEVEIINIKLDKNKVTKLLKQKGFYNSYHMKKDDWISIILDNTNSDDIIMNLIDESYSNTLGNQIRKSKSEWIIPANPKYYDLEKAFNENDIIMWKQSTNILVGDTVYLYVASPYSAIMYKCKVIKINIPYKYDDGNLRMSKVMKIKLLKKFNKTDYPFSKLQDYGIRAIRGPRYMPKELSKEINKE